MKARRSNARRVAPLALLALWSCLWTASARAQSAPAAPPPASSVAHEPSWYERIKLRGYTQVRYNRLFETNERLVNLQGDKSIGKDGGFFIRRARLILFGDVHEQVFVYLQPDFASAINDQLNVSILRDWYSDISFDKRREFRVRVGQSKVPFGFENMQSSQNRVPLDRSDPINSAVKDERDIGLFFYYAPDGIRRRFKRLVDDGLKGSGDYGVVGLGLYNGQTANQKELNDTPHVVARVAYPFRVGKQIVEPNLGGYTGRYRIKTDDETQGAGEFRDVRAYGALVLYPQPFGLQLEYNVGRGPEYVDGTVRERPLHGGYALATLRVGKVIPYVRAAHYRGGRKFETNALAYRTRELEAGVEWPIVKALELTVAYSAAERTSPVKPYAQEIGQLVRVQCQINY